MNFPPHCLQTVGSITVDVVLWNIVCPQRSHSSSMKSRLNCCVVMMGSDFLSLGVCIWFISSRHLSQVTQPLKIVVSWNIVNLPHFVFQANVLPMKCVFFISFPRFIFNHLDTGSRAFSILCPTTLHRLPTAGFVTSL